MQATTERQHSANVIESWTILADVFSAGEDRDDEGFGIQSFYSTPHIEMVRSMRRIKNFVGLDAPVVLFSDYLAIVADL